MKAKVTNEGAPYFGSIVDVVMVSDAPVATFRTIDRDVIYLASDLDFKYQENEGKNNKPSVDWDAYRREAAKDIVCAILSSNQTDDDDSHFATFADVAKGAVACADALIKRLQGK